MASTGPASQGKLAKHDGPFSRQVSRGMTWQQQLPTLMIVCYLVNHLYSKCETWHRMADFYDPASPPAPPLFGFLDWEFPYAAMLVLLPAVGCVVAGWQTFLSSAILMLWLMWECLPSLALQV